MSKQKHEETLVFRCAGFSPALSLLMPTFSFVASPCTFFDISIWCSVFNKRSYDSPYSTIEFQTCFQGYLKTFFLGYFLYVLIRILILFPVYQILLIAIGTLFGQFDFFSNFTKNTFRKIFLKLFNKIFFKWKILKYFVFHESTSPDVVYLFFERGC